MKLKDYKCEMTFNFEEDKYVYSVYKKNYGYIYSTLVGLTKLIVGLTSLFTGNGLVFFIFIISLFLNTEGDDEDDYENLWIKVVEFDTETEAFDYIIKVKSLSKVY